MSGGDGTPLDPNSFSHAVKRLMGKAGLPKATRLHDLTHGLATAPLEEGADVAVVSAILGHAFGSYPSVRPCFPMWVCRSVCRTQRNEEATHPGDFDIGGTSPSVAPWLQRLRELLQPQ